VEAVVLAAVVVVDVVITVVVVFIVVGMLLSAGVVRVEDLEKFVPVATVIGIIVDAFVEPVYVRKTLMQLR